MGKLTASKHKLPWILKYLLNDSTKGYRHYSCLDLVRNRVEQDDLSRVTIIILMKRGKYMQNEMLIRAKSREEFMEKVKGLEEGD